MEREMKLCRSLPPLVEGRVHGYLKLIIDEIVWCRRSPGDVTVIASWWGELDSAQFRPTDVETGSVRFEEDTMEMYAIRTNWNLFEEYVKNCERIEIVVVSEKSHRIICTGHISDLVDIFDAKPYFRYFPIVNDNGIKMGDIHVAMKLINTAKTRKMQAQERTSEERAPSLPNVDLTLNIEDLKGKKGWNRREKTCKDEEKNENDDIYKSILKNQRLKEYPLKKYNVEVTDKLVARVVARAQRLRGAILNETYIEDPLVLKDDSVLESDRSNISPESEAKLYEYFMGKDMCSSDRQKALSALRSVSPTPSLIDIAMETVHSCKSKSQIQDNDLAIINAKENGDDSDVEDVVSCGHATGNKRKDATTPLDHVDSIRIFVESLSLTPAGYRRVRSSCLHRTDNVPWTVAYFVQCDLTFTPTSKSDKKRNYSNNNKLVKMISKKQIGQEIYFNHEGVYDLPKSYFNFDQPIKFKVYNRHLNQRSPIELGIGSMCIKDIAKSEYLRTTQRVAMVNKGMKIGELKVTIELGCDRIHFGKQFVDAVMSTKENILVVEVPSASSSSSSSSQIIASERYKNVTGTESKTKSNSNCKVPATSTKQVESLSNGSSSDANSGVYSTRNHTENRRENSEDKTIRMKVPEDNIKDKVLLHGLIYIAEGKDLPESNTYLICRAFWREDRSASQICSDTDNPAYQFHQLVPIIHGPDLLERTKENCIVTEVYCRNSIGGDDRLLGIAKLPVHQLYVAYRDPVVLPHLLLSKYPVISVDGWVPIFDPINGQSRGQLLALVALGTADQIAFLEVTRGLRERAITTPRRNATAQISNDSHDRDARVESHYRRDSPRFTDPTIGSTSRTQGAQTEWPMSSDPADPEEDLLPTRVNPENLAIRAMAVDRLTARTADKGKTIENQATQTEEAGKEEEERRDDKRRKTVVEKLSFEGFVNNADASDSSNGSSPRENYNLPTEMYRSVGVGAEYDDEASTSNRVPGTSYSVSSGSNKLSDSNCPTSMPDSNETSSFRAVVEIECALHLPRVERSVDGTVEPYTYVTFQGAQSNSRNQIQSYTVTNVCPQTCNPRWDWRCDTRLPVDLLVKNEKRLILKVWRLIDPEASKESNLEKDVVIGFSAIDLSVLTTGFPMVSGWFHIMDFTGQCNGQIKVGITPLDNISSLGKSPSIGGTARNNLTTERSPSSAWTANAPNAWKTVFPGNVESSKDEYVAREPRLDNESVVDIGLGAFEDASMSFLSQSLKQKLTELDEITKRLQSRLYDVTNTAFEDDFDLNDFDLNDPNGDRDHHGNENGNGIDNDFNPIPVEHQYPSNNGISEPLGFNAAYYPSGNENGNGNERKHCDSRNFSSAGTNRTDTGYSTGSNLQSTATNLSNGQIHPSVEGRNEDAVEANNECRSRVASMEYPTRGTRTHISHLLDKLSTQLTTAPPLTQKRNIMELLTSLRQNNNNFRNDVKCNREINVRTVPTQTDRGRRRDASESEETFMNHGCTGNADSDKNREKRVSTVIREELVAEESNEDAEECDELTSHLLTSNVRHMDWDHIFNPLLYRHFVPDVRDVGSNAATSPDSEAVQRLDHRYSESFNASLSNGFGKLQRLLQENENQRLKSGRTADDEAENPDTAATADVMTPALETTDIGNFRFAPSGLSENVDGNIDVTVIQKSSNSDLMASNSNSSDSTTTISMDKSSVRPAGNISSTASTSSPSSSSPSSPSSSSTSSLDSSVPVISRQAPDGGNPVDENGKPANVKPSNQSPDQSSDS